jgi:hypothetical protein
LQRVRPGLTPAERVKKVGARAREESVVWQQGERRQMRITLILLNLSFI